MNGGKTNLNIYYSAICNMNCDYCCAGESDPNENAAIRAAIQDGSFQNHVIARCAEQQPVTLGIWGREPSINQDLWKDFIIPILNQCDSIKGIFLSTNGLEFDYHAWADCLLNYCIIHKRKIKLWVQWSIDKPDCDQAIINNLYDSIGAYHTNEYFRVKFSTKSTLQAADLRTNIDGWYEWMAQLNETCNQYAESGCDISDLGIPPTLARPGDYTQEDGIYWAQWMIAHINFDVDAGLCAAGNTSWTITYDGTIWNCPLKKNKESDMPFTFQEFYEVWARLLEQHQIRFPNFSSYDLYKIILTQWCWATSTKEDLESYLRVWCNGACP